MYAIFDYDRFFFLWFADFLFFAYSLTQRFGNIINIFCEAERKKYDEFFSLCSKSLVVRQNNQMAVEN